VQRIFEPFFTTKPVGVGTGLGLWISRNLIVSLGGTIEVESTLDVGTVFRVVLPAADELAP
jgi:two-component system, NtrC family, sensor kinase